jgi:L-ribulokinase
VVVSCADGEIRGTHVFDYPSGDHGVLLDPRDPHLARQNPADYVDGLRIAVPGALAAAERGGGFSRDRVIGIGVDTTGSTPIPVDARNRPLATDPKWRTNLAAHAWLWKDHTSAQEAAAITRVAREHSPQLLAPIGGTYSSEWFWAKIWHCLNVAPDVFDAAASWVELADFVPAVLAGIDSPQAISSAASAPRDTRRFTAKHGAGCRQRTSWRDCIRSSHCCRIACIRRPILPTGPPATSARSGPARWGCVPEFRSRWAASTRITAPSDPV